MFCTRLAGNIGRKNVAKNRHLRTIAQLVELYLRNWGMYRQSEKKLVKQQYIHMSLQYGELRPTNGWDRFGSLGHPSRVQRVSRLDSVTARHPSSRRQPNFGVEQRAPPTFGMAAITLGIGPHSSCNVRNASLYEGQQLLLCRCMCISSNVYE